MSDIFDKKKKQKPKRMYSDEDKKRIVEQFLKSNLPASKFAPRVNIVPHTLAAWVRKYEHSEQFSKKTTKRGGPYNEVNSSKYSFLIIR